MPAVRSRAFCDGTSSWSQAVRTADILGAMHLRRLPPTCARSPPGSTVRFLNLVAGQRERACFERVCLWCARGGPCPQGRRSRLDQLISGRGRRGQEERVSVEGSELRSSLLEA